MKKPPKGLNLLRAAWTGHQFPEKPVAYIDCKNLHDIRVGARIDEDFQCPGSTAIYHKEINMAASLKPGQSTGNRGGIFQEVGPRGGKQDNYAAVPDNRQLPPTTKPGHAWTPVKVTPDSNR